MLADQPQREYTFRDMDRKAALTLGLLFILSGLVSSAPSWAQPSGVTQGCSSPPLTNERSQTNGNEGVQNSDEAGRAHRKVVVERIEFDRPVHLSDSDVQQIIKTANEGEWDVDSDWVDGLAEIGLRSAGWLSVSVTIPPPTSRNNRSVTAAASGSRRRGGSPRR